MWELFSLLVLFTSAVKCENLNLTNRKNARTQLFNNERNFDAGCSRILLNEQSVVESPGYPSGYPSDSECSYLFKGPICPTYFNFQFLDFNLVTSHGCTKDRLEIQDQDALCGSVSGIKSYFSEDGALQVRFISDGEASGRGFKILVTRLSCDVKPETTTSDPNIAWEITTNTLKPRHQPINPTTSTPQDSPLLPFCCANAYNSKHFFLSSPGFPHSNNQRSDCTYHIYRANANVCRLRIHFLFFWSGEQDSNFGCNNGFLQVDGKFICGCRVGLKLISAFDSRWGNNAPKVLRFKNSGFPESVFSGFAIEVIQDECPKRIAPTEDSIVKEREKFPSYFYNDQINRSNTIVEKALLVKENMEILDDNDNNQNDNRVNIQHVYVYEVPEDYDYVYDVRTVGKSPRDIEETTYIDTSTGIKAILPDGYDNYKCRIWGGLQWAMLAQEVLWQQMPQCTDTNKPLSRQCEQVNYIRGFIQSPGYPYYYPGNLNLCYRLGRYPGYCAISLRFVDFQIENSFKCKKDYLMLGRRYRYCGRSLHNAVLTFDMRYKPYEEIYFITDSYTCGRGFKAIYEQIPCDNTGVPINPPNPIYPTKPTTPFPPPLTSPPPPPIPQQPCSRDIQDEYFVIDVYNYHQSRCVFNIQKLNPSICRLSLTFHNFYLQCGSEQLLINNRRYCGQINDQTLNINFNYYQLSIIYERLAASPAITGLRFRLSGQQTNSGCDPYQYPMVPAERSLFNVNNEQDKNVTTIFRASYTNENDISFGEMRNETDICGLIFNASENNIATAICKYLTERDNSTNCIQITAKTIYVPYEYNINDSSIKYDNFMKELDLENFDRIEKVGVNEITCDDIYRITDSN